MIYGKFLRTLRTGRSSLTFGGDEGSEPLSFGFQTVALLSIELHRRDSFRVSSFEFRVSSFEFYV